MPKPTFSSQVLLASALLATCSVLTPPADAATAPGHVGHAVKAPSPAALARARARQGRMLAHHRPAPSFANAAATTFTVDTTEDSGLATPGATACVDTASGSCSLRAAVEAADDLTTPVRIVLASGTYTLTTAEQLAVTNPAGVSIVGAGAGRTTIAGAGSRVLYAGAPSGSPAPLLYLTDVTVTGGTSDQGAGIYLDPGAADGGGATLVLDGVDVTANTASDAGGGVYAGDGSALYARATRIVGNAAPHGGGLRTDWSDVNLSSVRVTGNHTLAGVSGAGGGWLNTYGLIRMKNGAISHNAAGDVLDQGVGGGLSDTLGNIRLTDVDVDRDSAEGGGAGGGLWLERDLVEVRGGTMAANLATGPGARGGAVYTSLGTQLHLHGVTMVGNLVQAPDSAAYGGTLYLFGQALGNQVTIDGGSSITHSNAAAVYALTAAGHLDLAIAGSVLAANVDALANGPDGQACGGAICAVGDPDGTLALSVTESQLAHNVSFTDAGQGSGALSVVAEQGSSATVALQHDVFGHNRALGDGLGGAVGVTNADGESPISVRSSGNTFEHNRAGSATAPGHGGAVGISSYTVLSDRGSTLRHNHAVGDGGQGGAVYASGQQTSSFADTTFTHNTAGPPSGGTGYGGAVYAVDTGTAFTGVTMAHNRAATFGGGLATAGFATSVEKSTVSGNRAGGDGSDGSGGGIYAVGGALELGNSTVTDNVASGDGLGGGIDASGQSLALRYTTISGNIARHGAGIVAATRNGNLVGSILSANLSSPDGSERDCGVPPGAALHSLGGNVLGSTTCVTATVPSDRVSRHPGLEPLRDNGGATGTMALRPSSPAVGIGILQCPTTDQRGRHRPSHHCDAGAFELRARG